MSDGQEYIEDGYVKISRRVFGSKTFSSLNAIQKLVTFYLILMANHQNYKWWDNHEKKFIDIKRGSFITSVEQIRKKINDRLVTPKKIRLILSTLEKMEFLAIKTTNKYTLVTILKYNLYQNGSNYEGKQKGELRASKGQGEGKQRATNKNGNKEKNVNNVKKKYNDAVFLTDIEHKKLIDKYGEVIAGDKIEELSLYIKSQGKQKKYKDHYATILAWDKKNNKQPTSPAKKLVTEEEILKIIGGKDEQ